MPNPSLRDLRFGFASAEEESAQAPELLLEGYLDVHSALHEILRGMPWLVLGYKGSGKSAISHHIRLTSLQRHDLFVNVAYLADFPFQAFQEIFHEPQAAPQSQYPASWTWLLLLHVFDSYAKDEGAHSNADAIHTGTITALRSANLIPSPGVPQLVRISRKDTIRTPLVNVFEHHKEQGHLSGDYRSNFPLLVRRLTEIAANFKSDSEHVIVLDGLDDVFVGESAQLQILAAPHKRSLAIE